MRLLRLLLLTLCTSSLAAAQASAPAESRPIFRYIQLSRDTVELGRPLGALLRFARTPSDSIVTIPLGEFGGTDAIRVHRRASGEVTQMVFLYSPRHSMTALRDGYIEDLGPPQFMGVDSVQGIARHTWVWRDARTVFQLSAFATPIDGIAGTATMQDREPNALTLGRQVAARYDSAFAALIATASADTATYGMLLDLGRMKAQRVGWAYEQNGQLLAITTSRRDAYLVVVPASDSSYARMGSIMEPDPGASIRATRVKEDTIAGAWAAVFLAYELSHIRDDLLGLLPETATPAQFAKSTRRAYTAEYLAARAMGGRPLEQHLDSVLTAIAPKSAQALAEGMIPALRESFDSFDAFISQQKALTPREEQRRVGVYAAALLLRYAEGRRTSDTEFANAMRCIGGCR